MGYALESVIWKSEKQGWEAKTSLASPVDIPSHTRPVIPGGLLSSRAVSPGNKKIASRHHPRQARIERLLNRRGPMGDPSIEVSPFLRFSEFALSLREDRFLSALEFV